MAARLLGKLDADRPAVALGRTRSVDSLGAGFPDLRHTGPAGAADVPPRRAQRTFRLRRAFVAAVGRAGGVFRQCRPRTVRGDSLLHDLYLRAGGGVDRPCVDLCADRFRDLRRAGTLPDDGGPLAGSRVREQPHSRNPTQLHRRSGAADLYGHSLPLYGQNPRYVVAARRRRRLSRVRIHAFRAGREGAAVPDAEAALRLVFRPVQPDLAADAAPVLGRCDSPYERIRAYLAAYLPACLRRSDDPLRGAVPLPARGTLYVCLPDGFRGLRGVRLRAVARTRTAGRALAGRPRRPHRRIPRTARRRRAFDPDPRAAG